MSLKSGCWQISLAEKELTTGSNCSGKQRQGVILNMQLSKKAVLISKKASLSSPYLHPWTHIHWATVTLIESAVKGKVKGGVRNFPYLSLYLCVWLAAGCQKVIFKACHLGKLKLAYTSPNVISTNLKTLWWAELISQFFWNLNSSKNFTCLSGKLRTEFTSPIAKSTSPGLSDMTFFARCTDLTGLLYLQRLTFLNFHWTKF